MSLPELARESGVTAPYLSRLLLEHTARSFVMWRNRIRLERFMSLYRPGDNLMTAATNAGFGSYARFNHVFNTLVGCAPREWIKRRADGDADQAEAHAWSASYGMPEAVSLSGRQRWTRLVPFVGSAASGLFGERFLEVLVGATPQARRIEDKEFNRLDGALSSDARKSLISALRPKGEALAQDLTGLHEAVDFSDIYKGIAEFYGCSTSCLINSVAAFVLGLWVSARLSNNAIVCLVTICIIGSDVSIYWDS